MRLLKGPPTSRSRRRWKKAPKDLDKRVRCRPGGQQGRDIRPPARAAVRWPVSGPGRRVRLGATIRARPRRLVRESTCVCARGLCKTGPRPSRRPHGGPRIIIFGRPAHCPGAARDRRGRPASHWPPVQAWRTCGPCPAASRLRVAEATRPGPVPVAWGLRPSVGPGPGGRTVTRDGELGGGPAPSEFAPLDTGRLSLRHIQVESPAN